LEDALLQTKSCQLLFEYGIRDKALIEQLFTQFGDDYIVATIQQCVPQLQKGNIANPSGYIIEAIKKGYHQEQIEMKQKDKEQKQTTDLLQQEKADFKQQFETKLSQLKEQYVTNELLQHVLEEHKEEKLFYENAKKKGLDLEKNGVLRVWVEGYLKRSFMEKGEYDFEVYQQKI